MNESFCDREQQVLEAVRSGAWDPELRDHASHCRICADVLLVADFLRNEAEVAGAEAPLPSAGVIWWKAQLASRNSAVARATSPIKFMRNLACLAGSGAVVWFLAGSSEARPWLSELAKFQLHGTSFAGEAAFLAGLGTMAVVLLGSLYVAWAEK
jgi:hypothetical protein